MGGSHDASFVSGYENHFLPIAVNDFADRLAPEKIADVNAATYGRGAAAVSDGRQNTSVAYLGDLHLTGLEQNRVVPGSKPLPPKLEAAVDAIEQTCNGGLTGIGTDVSGLWNALAPLDANQYKQVNERFAQKYGTKYAARGGKWDISNELVDELSDSDLTRFNRMIADKNINDVPQDFRTDGASLLKPGSTLKVGEVNHVKLDGGRDYDVYIPRNADSRAPVVVAMAGAGIGDMKGVIGAETGLTIEAEKKGEIVVFAYPKLKPYEGKLGTMDGVAWNVPGRTNMPKQSDSSYDDEVYMDNVLKDLGGRSRMTDKVGMMGFSDGARFAEVYAADRPDRVAGVVAMSGTWMDGDRRPTKGVPIMIVHGDSDGTLPYQGGIGSAFREWLMPTNLDKSKPYMQAKVWSEAGGGDGKITERHALADVEERDYNAGSGTVKEYIIKGADHGVHDYKNNGSRFYQWLLGQPDMRQDFVTQGAGFLKKYIVRDLAN